MLTRANVKTEWSDDDEMDRYMQMSDAERAAYDAAFNREAEGWEREHAARLRRLTALQRYRYERHHSLISLLRCRSRLEMYRREAMLDFMAARETAFLKKRQSELLDWRRFLASGIEPARGDN